MGEQESIQAVGRQPQGDRRTGASYEGVGELPAGGVQEKTRGRKPKPRSKSLLSRPTFPFLGKGLVP